VESTRTEKRRSEPKSDEAQRPRCAGFAIRRRRLRPAPG